VNPVKAWFFSRVFREKLLVLALILTGAVIWLSSASDHLKAKLSAFRAAEQTLATQQVWIDAGPRIKEAAEAAVKNLDPSKTYNSTFLVSEILGIANRSGLTVSTDPPQTDRSPQFSLHTIRVRANKVELASLLRFYQELASKAPYIAIKSVDIQGDRANPGAVGATIFVQSVELVREGAAPKAK
jgi:hypothetical protein